MANYLHIFVIAVVWLECTQAAASPGSGLRCHQCTGVSDPHYCSMVVQCNAGEECHTEKVIGQDSTVFYNSGCQNANLCKLAASGKRSELHVCEGCCGTDLCNSELCPANNSTKPGVQCYQCDEVDKPEDCANRITCADGEQCIVTKYANDMMKVKYSLGCETTQRCGLLESMTKRSTQICNKCCDTPGCNRHLCTNGSTTVDNTCKDEPDLDCKLANDTHDICNLRNLAATKYCRKFCGYCSADGSTVQPYTGTTVETCMDSGDVDCKQMNDSLHLCNNKIPAIVYCPKYCGMCTPSTGSTTPATAVVTPDPCTDDPSIDCMGMNATLGICAKADPATQKYCPLFCGLCTPACADSPDVNCTLANDTQNACALGTLTATKYCRKFCGYCNDHGSTVAPPTAANTCVDSGTIDCKQMDDNLGICQQKTSPPTVMYCPKYCGLCH